MINTVFSQSATGYFYYTNTDLPLSNLCNPMLLQVASNKQNMGQDENEYDFYHKKYNYLSDHYFFKKHDTTHFIDISEEMIMESILNTPQVVFEVTDACNLRCKYCGYGELYGDFDCRQDQKMEFKTAKKLLDFLKERWICGKKNSIDKPTYISFYGGEPLLNMKLIQEIVSYVESWNLEDRKFQFSMTTNAILLDRYMDYLMEHQFQILISLDGDETGHSYRIDHSNKSSFDRVIRNVDLLKERYPDHFEKRVAFNTVLHNRNSVSRSYEYIKNRYNKVPSIASLNDTGIKPEKREEFNRMFKNVKEDLMLSENYTELEKKMFIKSPNYKQASIFLLKYSGYVFPNYTDLFNSNKKQCSHMVTGTCIPFSKKIFLTVNGKLLPCERIGHQFQLGMVNENSIEINFPMIVQKYNTWYSKIKEKCSECYIKDSCIQCIFNLEEINETSQCYGFANIEDFSSHIGSVISFFEKEPDNYKKIIGEVTIY